MKTVIRNISSKGFTGILCGVLLSVLSPSIHAANSLPVLTLQQAREAALQNNPVISVADLKTLAAQEVTREARAAYLPNISGNIVAVGTTGDNTRLAAVGALNNPAIFRRNAEGLTISQLITDFG